MDMPGATERPQQRSSFIKTNYHPFLFALMTFSALAELGITAFLVSAGNEHNTWPSPRYHSLCVNNFHIENILKLLFHSSLILFLFNAAWTTLFSTAYMLWISYGASHILASVASSVIWLLATTVLWVCLSSAGITQSV